MSSTKTRALTFQQSPLASAQSLPHCGRLLHTAPSKSNQFLVSGAMSRHRHFNRFLVNLGKCAASRCHVTLDSRERSHVSDDEHQAAKVASRAPITHAWGGYRDITLMEDAARWQRGALFRRSQSCQNLFLFGRRVPVDSYGAGGGRNWAEPVACHRNTGCSSERVAHFLCSVHSLWLCRAHYVFARISGKCRCAKCEREHDTRASNRRTAQATKPVFYSHAVIVIPFRILRKLI